MDGLNIKPTEIFMVWDTKENKWWERQTTLQKKTSQWSKKSDAQNAVRMDYPASNAKSKRVGTMLKKNPFPRHLKIMRCHIIPVQVYDI